MIEYPIWMYKNASADTSILIDELEGAMPYLKVQKYSDSDNKERYIDPIRKKGIPVTPEETVRQQVIAYLIEFIKIPPEQLLVEENLSHIDRNLRDRVDIMVWGVYSGKRKNLLLVECKAPGIPLLGEPTEQLLHIYGGLVMKVKVSLDIEQFSDKPSRQNAREITNRIGSYSKDIEVKQLADLCRSSIRYLLGSKYMYHS